APYSCPQRPRQIRRPRETKLGQDHGRSPSQNAGPLSYLSPESPCRTTNATKTITFTNRVTLMMLESPVQRNLHAGFGGRRATRSCMNSCESRSNDIPPGVLPPVPYQDMRRE